MIPYKYKDIWWKIRDWFNPRQKWLTKKISNHWVDKDIIFEICILEGIKHFIEGEHALGENMCYFESSQSDPNFPEWQKKFNIELKEKYEEITIKLPKLETELELAWKKVPPFDFKKRSESIQINSNYYQETYGEIDRLEKEICDLKTKIMIWAVTERQSIWT